MSKSQIADLKRFFAPESVALIGATDDTSKFGGRVLRFLLEGGYRGHVYPVNPRAGTVRGLPAFTSARDLPEPVDHVGIAVPAERVLDSIKDCAARGVKFATIFTAGFGETMAEPGLSLQNEIVRTANAAGIRIMGPNCNGMVSFAERFVFTATSAVAGPLPAAGRVGVVSQSGGAGQINVMWRAQQAGVPISHQVSCGNECDLELFDFVNFMVDDPHTDVVLVVAEKIVDGGKLIDVARRAAQHKKPIIIQKFGRSEAARHAALSHTGSVAGPDAIHDAAFHQFGILRARDANELYEAAMLLQQRKFPRDGRLGAVSISGGNVVTIADCAPDYGLSFPAYSEATVAALRKLIPGFISVGNPTDASADMLGKADTYRQVLQTIASDPSVDVFVPILTYTARSDLAVVAEIAQHSDKPVAVLWTGGCFDAPSLTSRELVEQGTPVFRDFGPAMAAIGRSVQYGRFLDRFSRSAAAPVPAKPAPIAFPQGAGPLAESASKRLLSAYGFATTREQVALSAEAAIAFARTLECPVAIKVNSADIAHKTEANAVRLNLKGADAVRAAYDEVLAAARHYRPQARLEGVLVQEMVPNGVELLVGVTRDPTYGLVVTVGLGGTLVEVLGDVSHRIPPFDALTAREMLDELRGRALLGAFRGRPESDVAAVEQLLLKLSGLCTDAGDRIQEIDLNPVVVLPRGQGCRIVDALIVLREEPA